MAVDLFSLNEGLEGDIETRAVLKINGQIFNTWKALNISRSIVQIAGTFSFTTSNRFAGDVSRWGFTTGDKCTIEIADQIILTGYLDKINDGYDLNSHDVTFTGRDRTADLVDCSYDFNPIPEIRSVGSFPAPVPPGQGEFNNLTVIQIIEKLCKPVDITVAITTELITGLLNDTALAQPIAKYSPESGDTVYELIAALCLQYAILPITTGDGNILLTRSGVTRAFDNLQVGTNILANELEQSDENRYSVYYVEGVPKTSIFNKKLTARGKLKDEYIKRYRPLVILAGENAISDEVAQRRSAWEARIRAGASRKVETRVRGWAQTNKEIWPLNGLVQIKDEKIGVNGEFLIAAIDLNLDSAGGELTTMSLVPPDAFSLKERISVPNIKLTVWDQLRNLK